MKIGIFDSGLGGLIMARAIRKKMPQYDYVYLGDTKRVPYGNRSHETVYQFTCEAMQYLFEKENCALVVLACNTASARALRKMQKEYLPKNFPERKILGVLIPTAEECKNFKMVGVLATRGTIASNSFLNEITKINKNCKVVRNPAPVLVPLAEEGENKLAVPFILKYLKPLLDRKIEAVILGCTHYPIFKKEFRKALPKRVKIISQDEIIPKKLKDYLARHPEVDKKLSRNRKVKILVTDQTNNIEKLAGQWFGRAVKPQLVNL